MLTKPLIQIDDEVREMTDKEFDDYKSEQTKNKAQQQEQEAKKAARDSALMKLAALGLTEAEIQAL